MTTLAFKNDHLIDLLKKRGEAIKNENWDKQLNLDREINELKNQNFDELISPCSVYVTFETEEGIRRALEYNKSIKSELTSSNVKTWFGDHDIEVH